MATLARYQAFAMDNAGNVLASPSVEVRFESSGTLATLYSDRAGTSALANPFTGDSDGFFAFHTVGGAYKITVTKDATTRTFRYVGIGTASEFDSSGAAGETLAASFGVVGDSVTDDTTALQNAINQTPYGGTLRLPIGLCKIIGSGSAILTRTSSINFKGVGSGSGFYIDASVPNTRDILGITPSSADRSFSFSDFRIYTQTKGRHAIAFDGGANTVEYNCYFSRLIIDQTAAGASIYGTGATGGVFAYSSIRDCNLDCIQVPSCGDGLTISENVLTGAARTCIDVTQAVGAGNLNIRDNVMASNFGFITVNRSSHCVIDGNELEIQGALSQANGALIDLNGGTGLLINPKVTNNIFSNSTGSGITSMLRLANCNAPKVYGNTFLGSSTDHVRTTSLCNDAEIFANEAELSGVKIGLKITDAGKRTSIIAPEHFLTLAANQTGSNVNTAQTWFPGGGATAISVMPNSTYMFEGVFALARTSGTTSHSTSMLFGGTAVVSSIAYALDGVQTTGGFFGTGNEQIAFIQTAGTASIFTATSSANEHLIMRLKGIVRFGADLGSPAGTALTFIPQFKYDTAPGGSPTVQANSHFRMKLVGSDTVLGVGFS